MKTLLIFDLISFSLILCGVLIFSTNNPVKKWLFSPSKLPNAPPMWLVIFVFGFCYNAFYGYWWVALPSLVVVIILNIFKITQESVDRLIFPSLRRKYKRENLK